MFLCKKIIGLREGGGVLAVGYFDEGTLPQKKSRTTVFRPYNFSINDIKQDDYLWLTRGIRFSPGKSCLFLVRHSVCKDRSFCPRLCRFAIFGRCPNFRSLFDTL